MQGAPASEAPAQTETVASGEAAPATPEPQQRSSDEWCARAFCGCWEATTLRYRAELRDAAGAPATGVDLYCQGEETPIARSDADGVLAFEIETERSPGCGYRRCRNMALRDPQGRYAEKPVTPYVDGPVTLASSP
jgi:hypothetical protein